MIVFVSCIQATKKIVATQKIFNLLLPSLSLFLPTSDLSIIITNENISAWSVISFCTWLHYDNERTHNFSFIHSFDDHKERKMNGFHVGTLNWREKEYSPFSSFEVFKFIIMLVGLMASTMRISKSWTCIQMICWIKQQTCVFSIFLVFFLHWFVRIANTILWAFCYFDNSSISYFSDVKSSDSLHCLSAKPKIISPRYVSSFFQRNVWYEKKYSERDKSQ